MEWAINWAIKMVKDDVFDEKSQISGIFENSIICHKHIPFQTSKQFGGLMLHKRERISKVNQIPHRLQLRILVLVPFHPSC